jgi:putative ABC transport system substrate-binding protein
MNSIAAQLGLELMLVTKRTAEDIDPAFATMVKNGAEGLVVLTDPISHGSRRQIIELAAKHRIPAIYTWAR